jgi:hypothetical protein
MAPVLVLTLKDIRSLHSGKEPVLEEQAMGFLPVCVISRLVPDWIHHSLNIDFDAKGKIAPRRFCRCVIAAGQKLPSAAEIAGQGGKFCRWGAGPRLRKPRKCWIILVHSGTGHGERKYRPGGRAWAPVGKKQRAARRLLAKAKGRALPRGPGPSPFGKAYLNSDRMVCGDWLAIDRACTPSCC